MQISVVILLFSDQISGKGESFQGGANCLRGVPPCLLPVEESQSISKVMAIEMQFDHFLACALTKYGHMTGLRAKISGWPQTWKTQGIQKIIKVSEKTQGNLNFSKKNLENSGKMKHDHQQKCTSLNFSLLSCSGKNFKISWKFQGKLREFIFSKMWSP